MSDSTTIRRALGGAAVAFALLLPWPGGAYAQTAWDAPLLTPPRPTTGLFEMHLVDPAGGDLAVLGRWRPASMQRVGLRLGLADTGDLTLYGGVDVSGFLASASGEFPLDVAWVGGAGAAFGDFAWLSIPVGISLGRTFTTEEGGGGRGRAVRFTPYVTPRLVLDAFLDRGPDGPAPGDTDDDDLDLSLAADLGVDVNFGAGWSVRFAATLGDRDALAVGVAF